MTTNQPAPGDGDLSGWSFVPRRLRPCVRCRAHRTNGLPCRKWAMHGQQVCDTHGGLSPQARLKAELRLVTAATQLYAEQAVRRLVAEQERKRAETRELLGLPPGKPLVTYRHARAYRAKRADMLMEQAARRSERDDRDKYADMPWLRADMDAEVAADGQ